MNPSQLERQPTPQPLHFAIMGAIQKGQPEALDLLELFGALKEPPRYTLLFEYLFAIGDLKRWRLVTSVHLPELTDLGTLTLLGHTVGFAEVAPDSCGGVEGHTELGRDGNDPLNGLSVRTPAGHTTSKAEWPSRLPSEYQASPAGKMRRCCLRVAHSGQHIFIETILKSGLGECVVAAPTQVSCGSTEGRAVKAEPSNHLGHPRSITDANDGQAAESRDADILAPKGQSGYQAPPAGITIADNERTLTAIPLSGQSVPVGNGAHPVHPSPFVPAGCAHEIPCQGSCKTLFGDASECAGTCTEAPKYDGNLMPSIEAAVIRAEDHAKERAKLFRESTGDLMPEYVCEGCGKVTTRLFSCDWCEGCNRRCGDCLDEHMAAGHESDSSTARQMYSGLRVIDGGLK